MLDVMNIACFNGKIGSRKLADPSVASYSLHLGIGVFDGIRAFWNGDHYYIHELASHFARLLHNATTLEMIVPFSATELETMTWKLLEALPPTDYYLRPLVYRTHPRFSIADRHQMPVDTVILAAIATRSQIRPLRCHLSPVERVSSKAMPVSAKICGTYVNTYLVRTAAEKAGFDEGIMLDSTGKIAEAAAANLFFIQKNTVITPALTPEIFPGITRSTLIKLGRTLGIEVMEEDIYPADLHRFEAAFSCATLSEIKPIVQIDEHHYETENNMIFQTFLHTYQTLMAT